MNATCAPVVVSSFQRMLALEGGACQHTAISSSARLIAVLRTAILPKRHGCKEKHGQYHGRHLAKLFSKMFCRWGEKITDVERMEDVTAGKEGDLRDKCSSGVQEESGEGCRQER